MHKVEVLSRRRLFDDFFKIDEARLRFERHDGTMSEVVRRLVFERGDLAAALVVNAQRRTVYLTEQFRYPAHQKGGGWLLDVVAGMIDEGDTPEATARQEILEEAGFEALALEPVATFFMSPGGSSERTFLFCAVVSDAARRSVGGGVASEHEDIKIVEWPIEEFLAKVGSGQMQDAKTLIAGYWLKDNLDRILRTQVIRRTPMPVSFKDILEAYEFASLGGMGEHQAFLCRQSGKVFWQSDSLDDLDELPADIEDEEKYLPIPDKRELDLGKPLVLDFTRQFLPNDFDEVRQIFNKRGAYAKFKNLLTRRRALDQWHDFEAKAEERALRAWCHLHSIELSD